MILMNKPRGNKSVILMGSMDAIGIHHEHRHQRPAFPGNEADSDRNAN